VAYLPPIVVTANPTRVACLRWRSDAFPDDRLADFSAHRAVQLIVKPVVAERQGKSHFGRVEKVARIPIPEPGRGHLWQLLHALTHAETAEGWPLAKVLEQVRPDIGRGRTVLVITPSSQTDWVGELLQYQRRDITTAALLLDAASFTPSSAGGETEGDLAGLQNLLADYGVFSRTITQGYPFTPLIAIKRKRRVLKTLFGTGRVIAVEMEEEV
jgi:hypothetical protein